MKRNGGREKREIIQHFGGRRGKTFVLSPLDLDHWIKPIEWADFFGSSNSRNKVYKYINIYIAVFN